MFDFLRNWTKSAEEKRQEALNAYLDDALTPKERQQFEQLLAQDSGLRLEMEQRRALKEQMRQLPRRRVPRNFTLDPAVYGRPQRQPLFQLYPAMRTAAVLTAFFFILAVAADLFLGQNAPTFSGASQDVALVEVTRVVTETVVEEGESIEVTRVVQAEVAVEVVVEEEDMAAPAAAEAIEEPMAEEAPALEAFAVEEPQPSADAAAGASAEASNAAEEPAAADSGESAAYAAGTPTTQPTPPPAPTMIAPTAVDATKSTVPRPSVATVAPERAVTTAPSPQIDDMDEGLGAAATAVPIPVSERPSISGLRWLQIGLGTLFIVFAAVVLYVRRQS